MESASSGANGSATVIPSLSALKSEQSRLKSERNTFQLKFAVAQRQLNDAQREILEERIEKERLVCELGDVKAELVETRSAAAALEAVEKGRTLSEADAELAEVKKVLGDREAELAGLRKQFEELKAREKETPAKSLREAGCQADTPPQYSESEHQINNPFAAFTPSTFTNPNRKTRIIQYAGLPPYRGSRVSLTNSSAKLQRKPETIMQKKVSSTQTPIHSTRPFASISTSTTRQTQNHCPKLHLQGLMTIGALEFSLTLDLGRMLGDWEMYGAILILDSMGMSSDFEAAPKAGSDSVRVGTGISGGRKTKEEIKASS